VLNVEDRTNYASLAKVCYFFRQNPSLFFRNILNFAKSGNVGGKMSYDKGHLVGPRSVRVPDQR